jgi:hypothetical protein
MADVSVTFGATDEGLEKTLKTVRTELNTLEAKVKAGGMSMTELEGTMKRIGQVKSMEKNIKAIGDQSKDTTDKVKTLGKASEEAGEKAKIGFGKIAVGATLAGAAAKLGSMAIEGAFAVAQKTVQSFGAALDMGGRLNDLADRTGLAVDRVLLLERAFQNAGVGADSLGPILNKMQKAIVDAEDGTSKAAYAFADLGLSLSQLRNLSPEEQLRTIGKAIAAIPDPAQRASTAMEIFGKSGGALNQVFANFDEEIETAKRQLGSLPEIMKAGSSQFDRISDNLVVVGGKFIEFAAGLIDKVKPALDAVTTGLSMIDAAKVGQEIGEFFVGAGEGMKMFQKAVDEFKVGNFSEGFKAAFEAIKLQAMETGNSIYSVIVASFKSAGQFIATIFDPEGMLMTYITGAFNLVGLKAAAAIAESMSDMLPKIAGFSPLRRGMEEFAATAKEDAAGLFGAMYYDAESLGKELASAGSEFSENFKKNMVGVTPLFDTTIKKQEEVVAKNKEIEKSAEAAFKPRPFNFVEISKAQQAEMDKAKNAKAEDERAANAEKARQEKLKESAALKRDEVALQLKINDAIASGNTKEQDRLKAEAALNKSIQDMIKSGMGEEEATKLANELERASRAADRTKNSLATKIGEDIKKRQDAEAVDPGGRLMKKAQEQIAAGRYTSAETTMRQIKDREADANIRGTGKGRDTRALDDIGRQDYGIRRDFGESQSDFRERIRLAREEGQYKKEANENMKKSLASTQKRMGEGMKKEAEKKVEENKTPMTLEGMVKAIQTAVEKLEMKLPQPVMV